MQRTIKEQLKLRKEMDDAYMIWRIAYKNDVTNQDHFKQEYLVLKNKCNEYQPPVVPF